MVRVSRRMWDRDYMLDGAGRGESYKIAQGQRGKCDVCTIFIK